ncbi:MAG: thioredoxin [Candidatus Promineifilaceae bacterium]
MAYSANVIEVHEATFEQDVIERSHEKPVVVDFWAAWCGPCRMLGPILERLASEPDSNFILAKVDVDSNQNLAMRYGIQGIPAVKAFKDGQVAGEFVGAQPEPKVRQFLDEIAPSAGELTMRSIKGLLNDRRWEEAEGASRELLADDPSDREVKIGLSRALIPQDKGCEAKEILEGLLGDYSVHSKAERLLPVAQFVCAVSGSDDEGMELTVVEAQYRQAARLLARGNIAPAMDGLLEVLRFNKDYRDGQVKAVLLGIFELIGDEEPLTAVYRREMASILF